MTRRESSGKSLEVFRREGAAAVNAAPAGAVINAHGHALATLYLCVALMDTGPSEPLLGACLHELGITRINLLVLTSDTSDGGSTMNMIVMVPPRLGSSGA